MTARLIKNRDGFYVDFDGTVVERELEYKPRRVGETYGEWEQKLSHAVLRSDQDAKMLRQIKDVVTSVLGGVYYKIINDVFWIFKYAKRTAPQGKKLKLTRPCVLGVLTVVLTKLGYLDQVQSVEMAICDDKTYQPCRSQKKKRNKEFRRCQVEAFKYARELYDKNRAALRLLKNILASYEGFLPDEVEAKAVEALTLLLARTPRIDDRVAVAVAIESACRDVGTCLPLILDRIYELLQLSRRTVSSYYEALIG